MRQPTPGPFVVAKKPNGDCEITDEDGGLVADVYGDDEDSQCWPVTANARRFAASPALYAALKKALNESGCDGDLCMHTWHEEARKAIRLADEGAE